MENTKNCLPGQRESYVRTPKVILGKHDLKPMTNPAVYEVATDKETKRVSVAHLPRRVLEAMMASPVFCASPVRLSDAVLHLRRLGFEIATETTVNQSSGERTASYVLQSHVTLVSKDGA